MNDDVLKTMIFTALAGGSGGLIKWLLDQYFKDKGSDVSPRTKRRLVWAAAVAVPTVLYLFSVLVGWVPYRLTEHVAYIVASFAAATTIHGEQDLPSGADIRVEKLLGHEGAIASRETVTAPPTVVFDDGSPVEFAPNNEGRPHA